MTKRILTGVLSNMTFLKEKVFFALQTVGKFFYDLKILNKNNTIFFLVRKKFENPQKYDNPHTKHQKLFLLCVHIQKNLLLTCTQLNFLLH